MPIKSLKMACFENSKIDVLVGIINITLDTNDVFLRGFAAVWKIYFIIAA